MESDALIKRISELEDAIHEVMKLTHCFVYASKPEECAHTYEKIEAVCVRALGVPQSDFMCAEKNCLE